MKSQMTHCSSDDNSESNRLKFGNIFFENVGYQFLIIKKLSCMKLFSLSPEL